MNLLDDPVFTVRTSSGQEKCSLPCIYHLLERDEVEGFSKLQAHQKQAWHCFLAQLGAIATENRAMPDSEDGWREALGALVEREAWNLYTEDLSKPAFMQPPVPEETLEPFQDSKGKIQEVDVTAYDVPVLSKNHALKLHRIHSPSPEHWVYLLVNVQTNESGWGRGKYPTSRMNGGYGSRPFFTTTPSLRLGPWIVHDIKRMHRHVDTVEERYGYRCEITPLLWTVPWNGIESFELPQMHPWYIDCCRRIRKAEVWIHAGTKRTRVEGVTNGQTGDPWAPVDVTDGKVLMPTANAFQYSQLRQILFSGDYRKPIGFSDVQDGHIVCRAMTPDDTAREFYLERVVPFSTGAAPADDPFESPEESKIAEEARWRVEKAGDAESILTHLMLWLFKDFDDYEKNPKKERKRVRELSAHERRVDALHAAIDERFFERLFKVPQMPAGEPERFWETILVTVLREQAREAFTFAARDRYWERLAEAKSILDRRIRTTFTYAKQNDTPDDDAEKPTDRSEKAEKKVGQPNARAVADL